ncbi:MAG: hypothetical protein H6865_03500 [Rhodospirillales bacterium]|nr:hypothetical protein [Alphaproteobacteria bacterium]MCB9986682.1 hypothetical protein [Rhodospirillales bacterium]USO06792.1 MAG: hypothetical protein H6866_04885 [Rhodospirillales bacterium]
MPFGKQAGESGNVLIYVLIAVVLFAALSFALTRQLGGSNGMTGTLDDNRARLKAEELINYATGVRSAAEQMRTMGNVLPDEFSFVKQGDSGYATPPNRGKIYHPGGGGITPYVPDDDVFAEGSAKRGWSGQVGTNVEWTASAGSDVILTFVDVAPKICKAINARLYKDDAIPVSTLDPSKVFINGGGDDADFTTAGCAACKDKVSYCVQGADGSYDFYNVIVAR